MHHHCCQQELTKNMYTFRLVLWRSLMPCCLIKIGTICLMDEATKNITKRICLLWNSHLKHTFYSSSQRHQMNCDFCMDEEKYMWYARPKKIRWSKGKCQWNRSTNAIWSIHKVKDSAKNHHLFAETQTSECLYFRGHQTCLIAFLTLGHRQVEGQGLSIPNCTGCCSRN